MRRMNFSVLKTKSPSVWTVKTHSQQRASLYQEGKNETWELEPDSRGAFKCTFQARKVPTDVVSPVVVLAGSWQLMEKANQPVLAYLR